MFVAFSDVHLTDESTAINVRPGAFTGLGGEIADEAEERGATEVHVALLGDILDLVRTDYWQTIPKDQRPWEGKRDPGTGLNADPGTEGHFGRVLDLILAAPSAKAFFAMLAGLPVVGGNKPRVTYVVGNHDRSIHNFPSLRARIQTAADGVPVSFATSVREDNCGVFGRHGHEWDPHCHGWHYYTKVLQPRSKVGRFSAKAYSAVTIGEVVTAEVMAGFIARVKTALQAKAGGATVPLPPESTELLKGLKDVNNLRPVTAAFQWLGWYTRGRAEEYVEMIRAALADAIGQALGSRVAREWDDIKPDLLFTGDLTDRLSKVLAILKQRNGLTWIDAILDVVLPVQGILTGLKSALAGSNDLDELGKGAAEEYQTQLGTAPATRHILYGHTHEALQECFAAPRGGTPRAYVNTGTFLPFTAAARNHRDFWTAHRMTYAIAYDRQENKEDRRADDPTFDLWSGLRWKEYT